MKRIIKGQEPEALRQWKWENDQIPENLKYDHANWPKQAVKRQMLAEQGHLCAYTMQTIPTEDYCHIEHVVPRSQPDQPPQLHSDYNNLLACFPGDRLPQRNGKYRYGAQFKGGKHIDENNFVSPLREDVERRFQYVVDGSVTTQAGDIAAESSAQILGLNHPQLIELRKAAIDERVLDAGFSGQEAEVLAVEVMSANSEGRFPEFCLAISHAARWYASRMRDGPY